jgi:hypothetical protein
MLRLQSCVVLLCHMFGMDPGVRRDDVQGGQPVPFKPDITR